VAGIPLIIGELGYIFHNRDSRDLEQALDTAMSSKLDPLEISRATRSRFGFETRKEKLLDLLSSL
jgi:glycosyltransferase involved in cell wall biosynthesis